MKRSEQAWMIGPESAPNDWKEGETESQVAHGGWSGEKSKNS